MHGEYKVPGGKLVVVDLDVEDGHLKNVRVAGDFFLEPDEAILQIDAALEGAAADIDTAGLKSRIDAALPGSAVLFGFTTESVAIAVRRALAQATDWSDYDWQLIHEAPQPPALHMALDEIITTEVAAGRRPPTLRVWQWDSPAVIIGSFQSLRNEVDPEGAAHRRSQGLGRRSHVRGAAEHHHLLPLRPRGPCFRAFLRGLLRISRRLGARSARRYGYQGLVPAAQ